MWQLISLFAGVAVGTMVGVLLVVLFHVLKVRASAKAEAKRLQTEYTAASEILARHRATIDVVLKGDRRRVRAMVPVDLTSREMSVLSWAGWDGGLPEDGDLWFHDDVETWTDMLYPAIYGMTAAG